MVQEEKLSAVLVEFARTLSTDYPLQAILDQLSVQVAQVLPVSGAGVVLMDDDAEMHFVSASDDMLLRIESVQLELGEGPCLAAYRTRERVLIPDMASDTRFPRFSAQAVEAGLAAVFSFPMQVDGQPIGALDAYRDRPGKLHARSLTVAQILADVAAVYIANARDRTRASQTQELLRQQALHDQLTGLPNRMLMYDRIRHAVARIHRDGSKPAVLFMDLDRFKIVNDSLGHQAGDRLLVAVGQRLQETLRPGDTLARLGGDEFAALCENINGVRQAVAVAKRIAVQLARPFEIDGEELFITASVGMAFATTGDEQPETLLRDADTAMYRAKERGGGHFEIIDDAIRVQAQQRLYMENDLRRAVERAELTLMYQPIVSVTDGFVERLEALVRWEHPVRGALSPMEFLPLAEETGLIISVGDWVLNEACRALQRWQELVDHDHKLTMAVNLSAVQVMDPQFPRRVEDALRRYGIDPDSLCFEVTETVLLKDLQGAVHTLDELKRLGVNLAIDDFGTGYSSLAYVQRFPVDVLKLDRTFIAGLGSGGADAAIVCAVVDLAHALDLSVVAEGVERQEQLDELGTLGCDFAQGFYVARPQPAERIDALLGAGAQPP